MVLQLTMPGTNGTHGTEWSLVDRNGVHFRLPRTMIFLGREECDIALKSRSVDKRHAVITYDHYQNKFKLKDLSSVNGTFVNESRIPEQVYVTLEHTDTIRFGYDPMVYRMEKILNEQTDSGLPAPKTLPAWASRKIEHLAECKGCMREQKIKHTCSNSEDISDYIRDTDTLHTCADSHNVESGYDTWPDRKKSDHIQPCYSKDSLDERYLDSPLKIDEEELLSRKEYVAKNDITQKPSKEDTVGPKGSALYGQPSWWGDEELEKAAKLEEMEANTNGKLNNSPIPSPQRPRDLLLMQNNNHSYQPNSMYMEIPFTAASPPGGVSPPSDKSPKHMNGSISMADTSGTAFAVTLEDEDVNGSPKINISANLSNFLPSKIRRSFRERSLTKKEKEQTKEDVSPTRQRKIEDLWNSGSGTRVSGRMHYGGYTSEGHTGSDLEDDFSIRSDGPPSKGKKVADTSKTRTSASFREASTKTVKSSPTQKPGVDSTTSYLINKMFQSPTTPTTHSSIKTEGSQPCEYSLYKEAKNYDGTITTQSGHKHGLSIPDLKISYGEPKVSPSAGKMEKGGAQSPDNVSAAGTYTIDDEPKEVIEARESIDMVFNVSESFESTSTLGSKTGVKDYEDSLCMHDDLVRLERERVRQEIVSSMDADIGSSVSQQVDNLHIPEGTPKWVSQWASLTNRSGKNSPQSPTVDSSQKPPSGTRKARPGTGRKLPNVPVKQSSLTDISPHSSQSSGPGSPVVASKSLGDVFARLSEPKSRKISLGAVETEKWHSKNGNNDHYRKSSYGGPPGKDYNRNEKFSYKNTNLSTEVMDDRKTETTKWRRYPKDVESWTEYKDDCSKSVSSINTDVLLQDTANVMAAMKDRASSMRRRDATFTKADSKHELEIHEGDSDTDVASTVAIVNGSDAESETPLYKMSSNKKSFSMSSPVKTDMSAREKVLRHLSSKSGKPMHISDMISDVMSETDGMDDISASSEASTTRSEDSRFKRQPSKGKGTMTMTRPNRAFALRRARLESEEETKPSSSGGKDNRLSNSAPKSRARSNSYSSNSDRSVVDNKSDVSLGAKIAKRGQDNAKVSSSFSRTDVGRHSLRMTRDAASNITKQSAKNVSKMKSGTASQPGSRSSSPKSQEWNAWERRKGYDPRRAVAEAKAKTRRKSTETIEESDNSQSHSITSSSDYTSLNSSLASDGVSSSEDLGSSHSAEIAKVSSMLARGLGNLSREENVTDNTNNSSTEELVRNMFDSGHTNRSAFSAPKLALTRSPSPLKSPPDPAAPKQKFLEAQSARIENGVIRRKQWDRSESYDSLIVTSVYQLSHKLKSSTDRIIGKLREHHHVSKTPSPIDELLNSPSNSDIPGWKSANQELAGILRYLRTVEHHLQVIDRAVLGGIDSGSTVSDTTSLAGSDQSQNMEHISRIRNERVAFKPIDRPSALKPWNNSNSDISDFGSKDYY